MSNMMNEAKNSMSRKEFLSAIGIGTAGILMSSAVPATAFASTATGDEQSLPEVDPSQFQIVSEEEIDRMWADTLANARATGAEIVLDEPHPDGFPLMPRSAVSATGQANITVGGVPDVVYLLASYENSQNGTRISRCYNKYAYGFWSTCENGSYSHVIADGGRTLVINATVTLRNGVGFAQSFKLYGSFGPTGASYLSASYI